MSTGWSIGPWGAGPWGGFVVEAGVPVNFPPTAKKSGLGEFIPPGAQMVPLENSPNQTLTVSLNIDGAVIDYFFLLHYNEIAGYWVLKIEDSSGNLILDSIPCVTGENPAGNVLGQFDYLGIGSMFIVAASSLTTQDYPGMASLGKAFLLIWGNTPVQGSPIPNLMNFSEVQARIQKGSGS